jgi:hypothetical protein
LSGVGGLPSSKKKNSRKNARLDSYRPRKGLTLTKLLSTFFKNILVKKIYINLIIQVHSENILT